MKRQTVMIVDDTLFNIEVLKECLQERYDVTTASGGDEALALLAEKKPDLILLDVMMPEMSGYELCRLLKQDPATRDIPIIFVTALAEEEDELLGLKLGAIDYITHPISQQIVQARVQNHLEVKRYRDLLEELATAADRAKTEFLRRINHELRTPLTPILGMTGLVLNQEQDQDKRKYLEIVQKAATNLLGIVEDLIETSRLEADGVPLSPRTFLLRTFLDVVRSELQVEAQAKGLRLELRVAEELPEKAVSDLELLRKLLHMVLRNALKFTGQGEVTVEVAAAGGPMVRFSILDTGIGIPDDEIERIFDDFTQYDGSTTRNFPGLGLGLGLARRIATLMGGRIWAEKKTAPGAAFHIELPLLL